jgi:hypothetical protein
MKIGGHMKIFGLFVVLLLMASVFAKEADTDDDITEETALPANAGASGLNNVKDAMSSLCTGLTQMLPVASMLMIILGGVIYASGQMMGAETRARANVWATAALTGALIAILITVVAPPVLTAINGTAVKC